MRTREARKIRRQSLRLAGIYGHKTALISHEGALALYGCYQCEAIMEIWDSPAYASGSMPQSICRGIEVGWFRKLLIKFISC